MGQTLVRNYVHIVFSTKNRQPFIHKAIEDDLFFQIGRICKVLECQPIRVGGYSDHVHILCKLSKKITLVELMSKVKSNSSRWMKGRGMELKNFAWQGGYACFSVDYRDADRVAAYIANQRAHHGGGTVSSELYREELLRLLDEHDLEYDVRYLWD